VYIHVPKLNVGSSIPFARYFVQTAAAGFSRVRDEVGGFSLINSADSASSGDAGGDALKSAPGNQLTGNISCGGPTPVFITMSVNKIGKVIKVTINVLNQNKFLNQSQL
jgi:hypothetical protein